MSRRSGFTLIEMLIVMIVIGLLAALGVLRYIDLRNHAIASGVVAELNVIRLAAYNHWADTEAFPPDAPAGQNPPALDPYLRGGFTFTRQHHTFDWEHFPGATGGMQVGVVVTSDSPGLMALLARRTAGGTPYFVLGNTLTFVIVGPDGNM
jgi:prepilin-type N-terminal cleavage/methylation domain-containing protein